MSDMFAHCGLDCSECKARAPKERKKAKTCVHCEDYPCGKMKNFLLDEDPVAARILEETRKTLKLQPKRGA